MQCVASAGARGAGPAHRATWELLKLWEVLSHLLAGEITTECSGLGSRFCPTHSERDATRRSSRPLAAIAMAAQRAVVLGHCHSRPACECGGHADVAIPRSLAPNKTLRASLVRGILIVVDPILQHAPTRKSIACFGTLLHAFCLGRPSTSVPASSCGPCARYSMARRSKPF